MVTIEDNTSMLRIKEFRTLYGIRQRELALLLGASVDQVKRSEATGAWPNTRLSDLYRLQTTIFYQVIQIANTAEETETEQPETVRRNMEEIKEECLFLIRKHEHNLSQLTRQYELARRFYTVLMRFTESLTDADEDHLTGLRFLEGVLLQKLKRSGPLERLKISIRVKSLKKQIENADDILNGNV